MQHIKTLHVKGTGHVYDVFWDEGWKNHVRVKLSRDARTHKVRDVHLLSKCPLDPGVVKENVIRVMNDDR